MSTETDREKMKIKDGTPSRRGILLGGTALAAASALVSAAPIQRAQAQQPAPGNPPNVLVIMTDDVGYWNISAYNQGMMGYRTPNIDRIAREGAGSGSITARRARRPNSTPAFFPTAMSGGATQLPLISPAAGKASNSRWSSPCSVNRSSA